MTDMREETKKLLGLLCEGGDIVVRQLITNPEVYEVKITREGKSTTYSFALTSGDVEGGTKWADGGIGWADGGVKWGSGHNPVQPRPNPVQDAP